MNASERYKILQNIVAQYGVEADLYAELAKAERVINAIDQGKMMPPPVPPEITEPIEPTMSQSPTVPNSRTVEPTIGKYDNLQNMSEGNRLLYEQLKRDKLYTKSYEDFSKQFADPKKLYTLYTAMKSDGFYTKPIEEFKQKYWPPEPVKTTVSIKDTREMDAVTNTAMSDTNRMHAEMDTTMVKHIAEKAKK